jgi:hypothetical protein
MSPRRQPRDPVIPAGPPPRAGRGRVLVAAVAATVLVVAAGGYLVLHAVTDGTGQPAGSRPRASADPGMALQAPGSVSGSSASPSASASASAGRSTAAAPGGKTLTLGCKHRPSACGFPDATNTGVPAGTTLQAMVSDVTITKSGTYSGLNISNSLVVEADHVTVKNSRIRCGSGDCVDLEGKYDTITDSEIGGGASGTDFTSADFSVYSGGTTNTNKVIRVNMHHADDGMRMDGGTTLQDSYIHDLSSGLGGSHSDGIQSCGGGAMSFLHNTIQGGNNDAIFLQGGDCGSNDSHPLTNVVVNNNLLLFGDRPDNGSSYGISVGRALQVTITNNHFDRGWEVGPVGTFWTNSLTSFTGNVFDDDGHPIPTA